MVDISLLVTEITFVVAEIIIKDDVIISYVAKITFIGAEIMCLYDSAYDHSFQWLRSFL